MVQEDREVKRLQLSIKKLKDKESMLPHELETYRLRLERQQQRVELHEKDLDSKRHSLNQTMTQITKGTSYYQTRLGFEIRLIDRVLRFVFIYIDPANPSREFSFSIIVNDDDKYEGPLFPSSVVVRWLYVYVIV